MNRRISRLGGVARAVVVAVQSDRITFIAASLAYYAFISLLPLLLLAVVAASVLGGSELAASVGRTATETFGPEAGTLVESALQSATGSGGATVAGTAVLLWSGLKVFRGLDVAFSLVYGTAASQTLVDQLRDGLVALVGVSLGIAVTLAIGVATARIDRLVAGVDVTGVLGVSLSVVGLSLVFLPLYLVFPDREIGVREAVPGAVFAAIGWTVLQTVFRLYAGTAGSYEAYGVLGGILLLVTFLYLAGLLLLIGAVLNEVLAGRVEDTEDVEGDPKQSGLSPGGSIDRDVTDDDTDAEVRELRRRLAEVEERTVSREALERDLKQYVRRRSRREKARGWGPYLVLLYGTGMTLGAFYFLSGGWAVLAMLVVWLSTLGLYALMLLVGAGVSALGIPGILRDRLSEFRNR
ncbi:hypothetical protein BRD04_01165 [Halobacteriales archaeon QS_9_67_17]|nr:MAG: hypothetical protein BRD04_01165 [Halobacteriales archaeon QS_9_67_17]